VVAVSANHGVSFPVADGLAGFHLCGSFRDVAFALQNPTAILAAVTLSLLLARAAKVSIQTAAALLLPDDEMVDRLVADDQDPFQLQSLRDLLGAPVLLQPSGNQVQLRGTELPPRRSRLRLAVA
jgi:hypothetical protein